MLDAAAARARAGASAPSRVPVVRDGASGEPPPLDDRRRRSLERLAGRASSATRCSGRGFERAVVGISGGVDSAVTAYLAARALGPENVIGVRMPYRTSSRESLEHAQLVIDALGIEARTVDISAAVDGYLRQRARRRCRRAAATSWRGCA